MEFPVLCRSQRKAGYAELEHKRETEGREGNPAEGGDRGPQVQSQLCCGPAE